MMRRAWNLKSCLTGQDITVEVHEIAECAMQLEERHAPRWPHGARPRPHAETFAALLQAAIGANDPAGARTAAYALDLTVKAVDYEDSTDGY